MQNSGHIWVRFFIETAGGHHLGIQVHQPLVSWLSIQTHVHVCGSVFFEGAILVLSGHQKNKHRAHVCVCVCVLRGY